MTLYETIEYLTRLGISDEYKILYLYISSKIPVGGDLEISNRNIGKALGKHLTSISKGINCLTGSKLLISFKSNGKRMLALSVNANPIIINNYLFTYKEKNINNNYLFIKKDNNITIDDCKEVANYIYDCFLYFDLQKMCSYLIDLASESKHFRRITNAVQLKAVLYSVLNKASKNKYISLETGLPEPELALKSIQNTICIICGLDGSQIIAGVDEEDRRIVKQRERNERILRKGIIESYQEKIIDISKNPEELQKSFQGRKFVSITAKLHQMYKKGRPPFYNLILKSPNSDILIYASILQKHVKNRGLILGGYNGNLKIVGEVFGSSFHQDRFGVKNIIRSIDEFEAIEILDDPNLLDTNLLDPADDAPF
jgi:hypothetical protein